MSGYDKLVNTVFDKLNSRQTRLRVEQVTASAVKPIKSACRDFVIMLGVMFLILVVLLLMIISKLDKLAK